MINMMKWDDKIKSQTNSEMREKRSDNRHCKLWSLSNDSLTPNLYSKLMKSMKYQSYKMIK